MDLRQFIAEALKDIVLGVEDAQRSMTDTDARISPAVSGAGTTRPPTVAGRHPEHPVSEIAFDIAVTVTAAGEIKAQGKVGVIAVFSADTSGSANLEHSSVSRIAFSVPVAFPRHDRLQAPPAGDK